MYWIEYTENGSCVSGAKSYEEALRIQHREWEKGIDTYIIKG